MKKSIKLKKLFASMVLGIVVLGSGGLIASAGEWSSNESWYQADGSYSPYYGNTSFYKDYDSNLATVVYPRVSFKFDSSAIESIEDYHMNGQYYGMDIAIPDDYDTTMDAQNYYYTSLPDAKFDYEGDPL